MVDPVYLPDVFWQLESRVSAIPVVPRDGRICWMV